MTATTNPTSGSTPTLQERKSILAEKRATLLATPNELRDRILALDCFNHQKIYLLSSNAGLKGSEIAAILNTNGGAVGNVLRDYKEHAEKADKAQALLLPA